MLTPVDILGNQSVSLGRDVSGGKTSIDTLMRMLYDVGAGGAMSAEDMKAKFKELFTNVSDPEAKKLFNRVFRMYSSTGNLSSEMGQAQYECLDKNNKLQTNVQFNDIIKGATDFSLAGGKTMSVMLCNSEYLTPAIRNADKVEMFLNFMPSHILSRCVPYLEVEFVFDRPDAAPLRSASLLKFLLGSTSPASPKDATSSMIELHNVTDPVTGNTKTATNMEMFTAPQTLVNMNPIPQGSRYTAVLDPTRPMATLESFTVNVTPTVGLYSYKKASLVFKLHDRARLAEIGDLIRPQIYTNTTAWVTYGWRHPDEPGNPYAEFINNNMLVREAYGIVNSQFAFDPVGQVGVTLELFTKGITELRTMKVADSKPAALKAFEEIQQLAQQVSEYSRSLNIGAPEGLNKEVRAVQIIESAQQGVFPDDLTEPEVQGYIKSLRDSLQQRKGIDQVAANGLIKSLSNLYAVGKNKKYEYKNLIKSQASEIIKAKFDEITSGADPFIMSQDKWDHLAREAGLDDVSYPYIDKIKAYNTENENINGIKRKLVSLGKLFTVFAGQLIMSSPCVDELQVYFHLFNDRAGDAAGTNIAEFPIDMPVFLDQYRQHIELKGTQRITLEEFLQLVMQAQVDDMRAVAYGFRDYFETPKAETEPALKKDAAGKFENAVSGLTSGKGPFVKPVLEMYVETVYKGANNGKNVDLLRQFQQRATNSGVLDPTKLGRSGDLTPIMRIHIFDKTVNPYKVQAKLLRSDVGGNTDYYEVPNNFMSKVSAEEKALLDAAVVNGTALSKLVALNPKGTIKINLGNGFSNDDVKRTIAKSMPSIIYGLNSTAVKDANLASKQDPLLAATQMLGNKSGKPSVNQPNGGGIGGMPLKIVPASMQMHTMGCPLLNFAQLFFCDFNTGTTADNIYGITGLTHTITPGKFESQLQLTFYDAYGRYENPPTIADFIKQLEVPQPISDKKTK